MKMKNKRHGFRVLALVLCLVLTCPCMLGMTMASDVMAAEEEIQEPVEIFVISEISEAEPSPLEYEDTSVVIEAVEIEESEPTAELEPLTDPETSDETPTPVSETEMPPPVPETEPPTAEPEPEPELEPTPEPATEPEHTDEPEPTAEPEPIPSLVPEYELSHSGDETWVNSPVVLQIRIRDINSSGWTKVEATDSKDGKRTELTEELAEKGFANFPINRNCTVHVFITDMEGMEHIETFSISCFDYNGPSVRAGINNTLLRVEAFDTQSGVHGIYVNGRLYTTFEDGVLNLPVNENTSDQWFTVSAVDSLGNSSDSVTIFNPFYKEPVSEHSNNCPDDCDCRVTSAPAPTQTPTPTQAPSADKPSQSGSSGGSQTGQKPVQSSVPTPTTVSEPSATPEPTAEPEPIVIEPGTPFSENGNFTTRDLLYDKHTNKQFIVVETRNGATFYMVIDYDKPLDEDGERYETYFLNMVDEADLLALLEDGATPKVPVCTCTSKCEPGHVDTTCEVCRTNMSECTGKEAVIAQPEPTTETDTESEPEPEKSSGGGALIVLLILALAGGGALYWFKFRKEKPKTKGPIDLDDYDYGEDDDEDYKTESDDADVNETTYEREDDYE